MGEERKASVCQDDPKRQAYHEAWVKERQKAGKQIQTELAERRARRGKGLFSSKSETDMRREFEHLKGGSNVSKIEKLAEKGCVEACRWLAHRADQQKDPGGREKWFLTAAGYGDVEAMYEIGWRYCLDFTDGIRGLDERSVKGLEWLQKAADAGNCDAMEQLAQAFSAGLEELEEQGFSGDMETALEEKWRAQMDTKAGSFLKEPQEWLCNPLHKSLYWYERTLEGTDDDEVRLLIARYIGNGYGTGRDTRRAAELMRELYTQEAGVYDEESLAWLADYYTSENGQKEPGAEEWIALGLEQALPAVCRYVLRARLNEKLEEEQIDDSIGLLLKSASKNPDFKEEAQSLIRSFLQKRAELSEENLPGIAERLGRSCYIRFRNVLVLAGIRYESTMKFLETVLFVRERFADRNEQAPDWKRTADGEAVKWFAQGRELEKKDKDYGAIVELYRKAAGRGHGEAAWRLTRLYGIAVGVTEEDARRFGRIAYEAGYPLATGRVPEIIELMAEGELNAYDYMEGLCRYAAGQETDRSGKGRLERAGADIGGMAHDLLVYDATVLREGEAAYRMCGTGSRNLMESIGGDRYWLARWAEDHPLEPNMFYSERYNSFHKGKYEDLLKSLAPYKDLVECRVQIGRVKEAWNSSVEYGCSVRRELMEERQQELWEDKRRQAEAEEEMAAYRERLDNRERFLNSLFEGTAYTNEQMAAAGKRSMEQESREKFVREWLEEEHRSRR